MSVSAEATVEARTDRLVAVLDERELDCLLVTNLVNVRYLTGFTGTNGACIVSRDERLFLTDFRYVEQASSQVQGYERVQASRDMVGDLAGRLRGRAGFEDAHLTVELHGKLGEKLAEGVELVPAGRLVEGMREVKDAIEVDAIRAAATIANEAYEELRERGRAGRRLLLRLHANAGHRSARGRRTRDLRAGAACAGGVARRRARGGVVQGD